MSAWTAALETQEGEKIREALTVVLSEGRERELDVHAPVVICSTDWAGRTLTESVSLVELALRDFKKPQCWSDSALAEQLLAIGAPLPTPPNKGSYASVDAYFSALVMSKTKLFLAMHASPSVVTERDEKGRTLLHHAVRFTSWNLLRAKSACEELCRSPLLDFNAQDEDGNTALHSVVMEGKTGYVTAWLLPLFLDEMVKRGSDFNVLNKEGLAALHYATTHAYSYLCLRDHGPFETFLDRAVGKVDLDIHSVDRGTAFFYAVDEELWQEANDLLDAGADPACTGGGGKFDPMARIQDKIDCLSLCMVVCKMLVESMGSWFFHARACQALFRNESYRVQFLKVAQDERQKIEQATGKFLEDKSESYQFAEGLRLVEKQLLQRLKYKSRNEISEFSEERLLDDLTHLQALQERCRASVFTKAQERGDTFAFWGTHATGDARSWNARKVTSDQAGAGYGF